MEQTTNLSDETPESWGMIYTKWVGLVIFQIGIIVFIYTNVDDARWYFLLYLLEPMLVLVVSSCLLSEGDKTGPASLLLLYTQICVGIFIINMIINIISSGFSFEILHAFHNVHNYIEIIMLGTAQRGLEIAEAEQEARKIRMKVGSGGNGSPSKREG